MKFPTQKLINLGFLLVLLAGCQSGGFTRYISPQISGRVLAADTRQPLAGVNIARIIPQNAEAFGPPKGGQILIQPIGVRTDAEGRFVLDSERAFAVFRQTGWWSVPISFCCSGYESLQRNYTATNVTSHTDAGAPMIEAGDILLHPLPR